MGRRIFSHIRQYETHRDLMGRARDSGGRVVPRHLDAIIVPASRPASNLSHAVSLARQARSRLVLLCSHEAKAADVEDRLVARGFRGAVVVEIPPRYQLPLLKFRTSEFASRRPGVVVNPNGDLSAKRNVGLLLARMAGWQRIFFMDDDVRAVSEADLRDTVSLLDRYPLAGMRVTDFPDNSVVCHARRLTGAQQDVFLSGSVLAADCRVDHGFFPDVYNEDWLFFYDHALAGRLGWSGHNARQLRYDPFARPERAGGQEFGDLLAEGLYALLHGGGTVEQATAEYWGAFIARRQELLRDIAGRTRELKRGNRERVLLSLDAAMVALQRILPADCDDYVRAWRADRAGWLAMLAELPALMPVPAALRELALARRPLPLARAGEGRAVEAWLRSEELAYARDVRWDQTEGQTQPLPTAELTNA